MSPTRGVYKTMKGNEKAWYAAFKSKDARFDGHFFVGVASTGIYCRTVRLATRKRKMVYGWIRVAHCPVKNALVVVIARSLLPALSQVLARVRHLFDLYSDPAVVDETLACMNGLSPGLYVPGTRLPGCFDPYELVVRTVLGRQISMKAANALAGRLARSHGEPVWTGMEGLTHAFPSPGKILP